MARPKEFDPQCALDKAKEQFWAKGYEATSLNDLVHCMGIQRGSLYNAFGDKHQLFLAALDRYAEVEICERIRMLEEAGAGVRAIRRFFVALSEAAMRGELNNGCFMVNTMAEPASEDEDVRERVQRHMARMEQAFYRVLHRARCAGELDAQCEPRALARHLLMLMSSLALSVRFGTDKKVLRDVLKVGLSVLK